MSDELSAVLNKCIFSSVIDEADCTLLLRQRVPDFQSTYEKRRAPIAGRQKICET